MDFNCNPRRKCLKFIKDTESVNKYMITFFVLINVISVPNISSKFKVCGCKCIIQQKISNSWVVSNK